jgi:hypothetical protein
MSNYYRNVFEVEVLSNEPLPDAVDLADLAYEITEGGSSGQVSVTTRNQQLTAEQMRAALIRQGSDPEFLVDEWTQ